MQKVHAYERLTHKYVDSCRHLDNHRFVGTVRLTPPQMIEQPRDDDHSDGGRYVQFGRLPVGVPRADMVQALADTLTKWGCHHEHDCCGCRLVSAHVHIDGRRVVVHTTVGFNY